MTLDEQLAILQAAKEGKRIKRTPHGSICASYIVNNNNHAFDFTTGTYEIQREPMEIWVNVYTNACSCSYQSPEIAKQNLAHGGRTVKFREVLED